MSPLTGLGNIKRLVTRGSRSWLHHVAPYGGWSLMQFLMYLWACPARSRMVVERRYVGKFSGVLAMGGRRGVLGEADDQRFDHPAGTIFRRVVTL
jgi:hypothetical protein